MRDFHLLRNQVFDGENCAILYDQCDYQGNKAEICDELPNFSEAGFSGNIYSIYIPDGYTIELYSETDFGGKVKEMSGSIACLEEPVKFNFRAYKATLKN